MQNPKIAVCIFRRFHFAKSEDSSLHFPNFDSASARCRQANARNILDQLHAQKTPVGTRRKSGVAKTGGLVPSEGIFSLVLAKPQVWFLPSLFSAHNWQDRRSGTSISAKFGSLVSDARRNPRSGNSLLAILGTKLAVLPEGGYQTGNLGAPGYQTP